AGGVGERRGDSSGPVRGDGSGCEGGHIGLHEVACGVADDSVAELALNGVGKLGVADGVGCLSDGGGDAIIALDAVAYGPFYGGAAADGGLPLGVGFAEEVGPGEGGAAAVVAVEDDDGSPGRGDAGDSGPGGAG